MTTDSLALLRRYVADRSEPAFTELVGQHIALVYSSALRQVGGDAATAQDVTQAVFTDLARKAPRLTRHTSLTGWLYTSTRFLAAKARRAEDRRCAREQQAHAMNEILQPTAPNPAWEELRPVLDDAMHELSAADREAVLLRFFERRSLAEVGAQFGLTENAARMRVERALEKLRAALAKRGVTSTATALVAILAGEVMGAVPVGLAARVSRTAFAAGSAGGGLLALLLRLLAPTQAKLLIGGAALVFVIASLLPTQRSLNPADAAPVLATAPAEVPPAADPAAPAAMADATVPATATADASSNRLVLHIVAADSGRPIPLVELNYWFWEGAKLSAKPALRSTRFGVCAVPVPRATVTQLTVVSKTDGFANTRLEWRTDRGEQIPEEYTLRVALSVPIGGSVVDADNQAVAGAEVGFSIGANDALATRPQSDNFSWPSWNTTTTDAEGRWRIDRFATGVIRSVTGRASHSDHVESGWVSLNGDPDTAQQLLAGTFVFKLGRAVTVRGQVLDPDGQPVAGAHVLSGHVDHSGWRETTTFDDGSFVLVGCRPGKDLLSAEARGFAAVTLEVELTEASEPFTLTLQRGNLLRLRVVNRAGLSVAKATVWLDTQEHDPIDSTVKKSSPVQAKFERQTDADGRMEWDSAPDAELRFRVSADGYMGVRDVLVRPDGQEHTITLPTALTISGTVRDAASGQPIPRFRIITGMPVWNRPDNTTNSYWSDIDRFWLSFEGGKFRHVYHEAVMGGTPIPGFLFKFEAEGYAPLVTRQVQASEGEVRFEVVLKADTSTSVTVLLPDGRVAAKADIGLVSPRSRLHLAPGGFANLVMGSDDSLLATDAQGRFSLLPDDEVTLIIAAHPAGYAEVAPAALVAEPTIRLQPWGRIEGTLLSGVRPAAGRRVWLLFAPGDPRASATVLNEYQVKTDADGRFVFAQVAPGRLTLVEAVWSTIPGDSRAVLSKGPPTEVEVRAGETTAVTVAGANE
jgi:RNA polymerase sigma factor (sigma-70 family)